MSNTDTSAQPSGAAAGEVTGEKSPEEFASILKQNFRIKTENDTANALVDSAMSTFLSEALSDQTLIKDDVYDTIDEMIAKLDEIAKVVRTGLLRAWIVGAADPAPVSAAIRGEGGLRTCIHA